VGESGGRKGNDLMMANSPDPLLAEQLGYYRAVAAEYGGHATLLPGGEELVNALDGFKPAGRVLELACGPGTWTGQLLEQADQVTAVDASPELLAIAKERAPGATFVQADVFDWEPHTRWDVVFFGFWLSHVPLERFESFWGLVDRCLEPGGRVFFCDDGYITEDERMEGEPGHTILRRLNDGTEHRVQKIPHEPAELERRLADLGWRIAVTPAGGPFYWGAGGRA
jgi:SAM-dependent methyltransferase